MQKFLFSLMYFSITIIMIFCSIKFLSFEGPISPILFCYEMMTVGVFILTACICMCLLYHTVTNEEFSNSF